MGSSKVDTSRQDKALEEQTAISQQNLELQRQQMAAQAEALAKREQESLLVQQQMQNQAAAYEQQLGLLSQQVTASNEAAEAQKALLSEQTANMEKQRVLSDAEAARGQYQRQQSATLASEEMAAATAKRTSKNSNARSSKNYRNKTVGRVTPTSMNASERRSLLS